MVSQVDCPCGVKLTFEGEVPKKHLCFRCGQPWYKAPRKSKEINIEEEQDGSSDNLDG